MLSNFRIFAALLLIFQCQISYCSCDDFQTNVDGFIDAFEDVFSTEINTPTTDEIKEGNEIPGEASMLGEGTKENEEEPVQEEPVVTEMVFQPGSEIKHELTEELHAMAEKAVTSISADLKLVNLTEAASMVTDKIQRSLSLTVARKGCEDSSCAISCRVELVSEDGVDTVTWHNCLDSANSNEVIRDKRGAVGGFKQVDDAEAKELAEIAAQTLDSIDADDTKRIVTQVIRAQKQLVNGIMYHLTLEIAMSDCKEEDNKCEGKLSDHNICKILMQRLFSGEAPHNAQVIKSECTPISKAKDIDNRKNQKRVRRHVDRSESNTITDHVSSKKTYSRGRAMGGKTSQDTNSDKIKEISEFALAEIDKASNSLNKQKIVRVVDAQSQVVAGVKYFLKLDLVETNCRKGSDQAVCNPVDDQVLQSCEVVVWDKPWDKHSRTVTKIECSPIERRVRRTLVGGTKPADPNDAAVKEMAEFAVSEIDARSNSLNTRKIIKIKEAKTQVVAGTNYFIKLQLVETNCPKGTKDKSACGAGSGKVIEECDVVVYNRPWDKHREMTSVNCSPAADTQQARQKRALVGGRKTADPNDATVKEMAEFAVSEIDARSNSLNTRKIIKIKEAQTQVVAGVNYFLKLQLVETNCRKGTKDKSTCSASSDKVIEECDVVVYDRPWDKHREMTSVNCSPAADTQQVRRKRDILAGGNFPQDKDSDEIKEIAEFAVSDMSKKSNSMYKQTLVEIISAESQIVAGVSYHLKLRVAESDCRKNNAVKQSNCSPKEAAVHQDCDVTVWSRPWLKKREVTKSDCKQAQIEQAIGGLKSVDPLAPEVLEAARLSLQTIDRGSNSMYKHALIRVVDAKMQTVSGKKYFLTVEVGESECTKNRDEENCAVRPGNTLNDKCSVIVWDQPWLNKKEVVQVKCGDIRNKRYTSINDVHLSLFEDFKRRYNKEYVNEVEHKKRFRIFRANLKKIQTFQENEQGTALYGPNMFADLTAKEFRQKYLGLKLGPGPKPSKHHMTPAQIPDVPLPTDFDWRDHNAVTPVKNQGMCGSCWAFSVTGNVEGQWSLKHGKLLSLSEQELVDCDKTDNGCSGGYMTSAYEAIENLGGLETEDEYPYDGADETCKFNKSEVQVTVASSVNITTNETQIAQWLFANGPISIGINANAMQFYMGGVSHPFKFLCSKNQLDHGVLLVGFGIHNYPLFHKSLPFWIIKNSWGPRWGEQGYYRVYRGDGTCGVNQMASSAVVG